MKSVILVKQSLIYSMVETDFKFVKAPSHSEIETPDRSVGRHVDRLKSAKNVIFTY